MTGNTAPKATAPKATAPKATAENPLPLDHTVTAPIETGGAFAVYLTVPGSVELLGTGRAVKVAGTIEGRPFAATLMPSGGGPHWLPLRKAIRTAIGTPRAGTEVTVHLTQRSS